MSLQKGDHEEAMEWYIEVYKSIWLVYVLHDDLIFAFLSISFFKSQIIEYAEFISCFIFYKKLFKLQKMTDAN